MRFVRPRIFTVLALATLAGCGGSSPAPQTGGDGQPNVITVTDAMGSPHAGDAAPDFELSDGKGATAKLSSLRGSFRRDR
jgi:ABC-type glycerol-3-phosphate transport system substrate-binding protein